MFQRVVFSSNRRRTSVRQRSAWIFRGLIVSMLIAAEAGQGAGAQGFDEDPNWPCVQRKVPEISAGTVWAGPPLPESAPSGQGDPAIAALAVEIASRRTPIAEASRSIERFAETAGSDKSRKLTSLFAGALDRINQDRAAIIAGIERYAKRQKALANKIERQSAELAALPADGTAEQVSERNDLQDIQDWDIRIFEEREQALSYICEQPVILEQRAFSLGREIMKHLD